MFQERQIQNRLRGIVCICLLFNLFFLNSSCIRKQSVSLKQNESKASQFQLSFESGIAGLGVNADLDQFQSQLSLNKEFRKRSLESVKKKGHPAHFLVPEYSYVAKQLIDWIPKAESKLLANISNFHKLAGLREDSILATAEIYQQASEKLESTPSPFAEDSERSLGFRVRQMAMHFFQAKQSLDLAKDLGSKLLKAQDLYLSDVILLSIYVTNAASEFLPSQVGISLAGLTQGDTDVYDFTIPWQFPVYVIKNSGFVSNETMLRLLPTFFPVALSLDTQAADGKNYPSGNLRNHDLAHLADARRTLERLYPFDEELKIPGFSKGDFLAPFHAEKQNLDLRSTGSENFAKAERYLEMQNNDFARLIQRIATLRQRKEISEKDYEDLLMYFFVFFHEASFPANLEAARYIMSRSKNSMRRLYLVMMHAFTTQNQEIQGRLNQRPAVFTLFRLGQLSFTETEMEQLAKKHEPKLGFETLYTLAFRILEETISEGALLANVQQESIEPKFQKSLQTEVSVEGPAGAHALEGQVNNSTGEFGKPSVQR